jgi:hypothetical protein
MNDSLSLRIRIPSENADDYQDFDEEPARNFGEIRKKQGYIIDLLSRIHHRISWMLCLFSTAAFIATLWFALTRLKADCC